MNKFSYFLFFSVILFSCESLQKKHIDSSSAEVEDEIKREYYDCSYLNSLDIGKKATFLVQFYDESIDAEEVDKKNIDKDFFCTFPKNFKEMQLMFGHQNVDGVGTLYRSSKANGIIKYFQSLTTIPDNEYYDKYIDMCIDGFWQADYIRKSFGFGDKIKNDTEVVCARLSKRTDEEIKSVFKFVLDGMHPGNGSLQRLYNILFPKIMEQDDRLKQIFEQAYEETLAKYGDY